ncbi:MAG: hypothetical protein H7Z40_13965 [Phycisphaerae bacterium]|nr:hypothetical protein [Gemmatimonadaceae bacterium]
MGNDPVSVLVLQSVANNVRSSYALHGDQRSLLANVVGLEVVVRGRLTASRDMQAAPRGAMVFQVQQFEVRAADGIPTVDGVITIENGSYFIVTQSGDKLSIPHLPAELHSKPGTRVFLAGSLLQAPSAYGIVTTRP